jgi:serine/threonine protein kinase
MLSTNLAAFLWAPCGFCWINKFAKEFPEFVGSFSGDVAAGNFYATDAKQIKGPLGFPSLRLGELSEHGLCSICACAQQMSDCNSPLSTNSSPCEIWHLRVCSVKMFKKTVKGEIKFPPNVSEECADLISKLLKLDPTQRLGMQRHGAQDIKDHPWYKGFDWKAFEAQTMAAPYVPVVRGILCFGHALSLVLAHGNCLHLRLHGVFVAT